MPASLLVWAPRTVAVAVFVFLAVLGAVFLCFIVQPTLPQLFHLAADGHATTGVATTLNLADHASCSFVYRAAGRAYTNTASCPINHVGQGFTVYYAADEPSLVTIGNPTSAILTNVGLMLLAVLAFSTIAAVGTRKTLQMLAAPSS